MKLEARLCETIMAATFVATPRKLARLGGFWWHLDGLRWPLASGSGGHFGGAWDSLRVEGFIELEREVTDSLSICFGCQFFDNDLPRSISFVLAVGHVSP